MTPYLQDADCTLYHGDVLDVLRQLPDASVDCCVTSPPYWGLRDYGTGVWDGGDEGCDHRNESTVLGNTRRNLAQAANKADGGNRVAENRLDHEGEHFAQYRDVCGKCGATRIDQQLGLESTPEEYAARMVEVFREVRRVLAAHGTVWLNLGDSYNANQGKGFNGQVRQDHANRHTVMKRTGFKPKDLVGIPWRVAFALQADGWYLRSDIIWAKPNPMPESVTDRPTKAHEYVFLLSKQPRYFFDQEAVREAHKWQDPKHLETNAQARQQARCVERGKIADQSTAYSIQDGRETRGRYTLGVGERALAMSESGRNIRSVWEIATQPYPEAHFATFPEELARRCIAAGCPEQVCRVCGKARERMVERMEVKASYGETEGRYSNDEGILSASTRGIGKSRQYYRSLGMEGPPPPETVGWTDCGCGRAESLISAWSVPEAEKYRPGIVLDPFMGSGTVAYVARKLGRHSVGIDLNESYLKLAAKRLQQQSLFAEV